MSISNRLRYEIFRRDGFTCRYCGASAPDVALEVDHVVPVALGGSDKPANLTTACVLCNSGKSSVPPNAEHVADVNAEDLRWAASMRQAAHQMESEEDLWEGNVVAFDEAWSAWSSGGKVIERPADWRSRIRNMSRAHLPLGIMLDLIDTAMANPNVSDTWAYFIGCCMRRIDAIQDRASDIHRSDRP